MKRNNVLALLVGACLVGAVAVAQTGAPPPTGAASKATKKQAQALFNEGKRLHDSGDYEGALEKFRQGAVLEPTKGRWPYNQALALRKLRRKTEARDAFLKAREVEPGYRRADVTKRLKELGFSDAAEAPSTPAPRETPPDTTDTGTPETDVGRAGTPADGFAAPVNPTPAPTATQAEAPRREADDPLATALGFLMCCGCPVLGAGGGGYLIYRLTRKKRGAPEQGWPQSTDKASASDAELESRAAQLERVSDTLIRVEHALRLGEDDDARALLNRATQAEQRAYEALTWARRGKGGLSEIDSALYEAESAARDAEARAQTAFGPLAFSGEGERVGCYFCARPLANSDFRVQVPLKRSGGMDTVLACRPCANMASAGQAPQVTVRQEGGRTVHWSELPDFDPYAHRHRHYPGSRSVPAYDFAPQRSVGELAAMAAGGAVVGGLAAYGVSKLLDLDNAREAAASQAAAEAMAMRASQERSSYSSSSDSGFSSSSSSSWSDHS